MELLEKLPELIAQYGGYLAIAAGVIMELVLRGKKTEKPMSMLRVASRAMQAVARILDASSKVLDKVVKDKV
jgi:hypothetical protein